MNTFAVKLWLHEHGIKENYYLNHDNSVVVDDDVTITLKPHETEIPIQFSHVDGDFFCYKNNLKNLKGFPHYVKRSVYCHQNKITSLEGCPKIIGGKFYIMENPINKIDFLPEFVGKDLHFSSTWENRIKILENYYTKLSDSEYSICLTLEEIQAALKTQALYDSFQTTLTPQTHHAKRKI